MLDVYVDPCTINCRKVLAGLDLLDVPFNNHFIDYFKAQQKSPEFVQINPMATIPAAVDGPDCVITESNAILQYAADTKPGDAYPTDLKKRAQVNKWLLWEASAWFPSCYVYLVEYVVKPLMAAPPDEAVIAAQTTRFHQLAAVLEMQLAKTKWLCGETPTIADIAVASPMHLHAASKLPLEGYPNVRRWMIEGVESLPCWQKTQPAVDKALLPGKTA